MNAFMQLERPFTMRLLTLVVLVLILGLYSYEFFQPTIQSDDAYISYRYAQNLVDGHGLVFNVGERVEGYTNMLWMLMVALGIALGASGSFAGHCLGFASGFLLLLVSYAYCRILLPTRWQWLALSAPVLVYASNSFVHWTISGLETPLFATLVTAAMAAFALKRMGWVLVLCILASLTRPEGALLAAVLLGFDWLSQVFSQRPRRLADLLRISAYCLIYALFIAGLTLFRVVYYDAFLPNTFYAKTGGLPFSYGPAYLYRFLAEGALFLLIPALVALRCKSYRIGFAFLFVTGLYLIAVGGDVFPHGRFLLPVLPILIAGALLGIAEIAQVSKKAGVVVALILPAFVLWSLYSMWPRNTDFPDTLAVVPALPLSAKRQSVRLPGMPLPESHFEEQVAKLQELNPPVQLVAAIGIGMLGYVGRDLVILDLVGLTNRHIARSTSVVEGALIAPGHQRFDTDYVFSRRPDVIFIPKLGEAPFVIPTVLGLHTDPRLIQEYEWDAHLEAYVRKAALRQAP